MQSCSLARWGPSRALARSVGMGAGDALSATSEEEPPEETADADARLDDMPRTEQKALIETLFCIANAARRDNKIPSPVQTNTL